MNTRGKKMVLTTQPDVYAINSKICRLVSKYPCLYARSDANYLKSNVVKNVWTEIGEQMNMLPKVCQQRWINIRSNYIRSVREHADGSTYYLTNELQFFHKYIPTSTSGSRGRPRMASGQEEDRKPKVEPEAKPTHAQSPNLNESKNVDTSYEEDSENGLARKKLRLSKTDKENVQSPISNIYAERVWDFDEAFLQGLRPEIKKMNFTQKLYFKRRLYNLLGEIFATESTTPSGSNESTEVTNENENVSEPSISPMQRLPKLTPKPQKNVTFEL